MNYFLQALGKIDLQCLKFHNFKNKDKIPWEVSYWSK